MAQRMPGRGYFWSLSATLVVYVGFFPSLASSETKWQFNDGFIVGSKNKVNLDRFSISPITEGVYSVDVYTNDSWKGRYDLTISKAGDDSLRVCYTTEMLVRFGIMAEKLNPELSRRKGFCGLLSEWNNDIHVKDNFSASALRLDISVPQLYEDKMYRGYVPADFWDTGIAALNLGYMSNYYANTTTTGDDSHDASAYLGLNGGLSWNGWFLKHLGNLSWEKGNNGRWNSNQTYLQRPLPAMKSVLLGGQFATNGEFFDSINLRGMSLTTDDNMFPDGMRSYAPEIHGSAASNALVTVKQGNNVIYQTSVTPGPFNINDVYPSGYGNDLIVTVKEADGSEHTFTVPYASVAQQLRPGMMRYALAIGETDIDGLYNKPTLFQGTWQYGVNNLFTGYLGASGFDDYQAYLLGVGMNTGIGAFSLDVTQSQTHFASGMKSGQSFRATFNRMFDFTQTNLVLAAYRYSTKDFYKLSDALYDLDYQKRGVDDEVEREKNGFSFTISQDLPQGWGGFYLSGDISNYWNRSGTEKQYQLSYNNIYGRLAYSVSLQRVWSDYDGNSGTEDQISLNVSYPLWFGEGHTANINSNASFTSPHFNNAQIGVNGALGENDTFSYGAMESVQTGGEHTVSLNSTYRSPYSTLSGSYSQGEGFHQSGIGASGSLIAHSGGVTLSPDSGSTIALVEAKGAEGATLAGAPGTRIDSHGYAVLPYLRPYRTNEVALDPKGSSDDVSFANTVAQVVPWEDSVVKVAFNTTIVKNSVVRVTLANGEPLPFGSQVQDSQGKDIGVVGQGSMVFINAENITQATVRWDKGHCLFMVTTDKEAICQ